MVMHCKEDVEVTLGDVAFVPGVPFDLLFCSYRVHTTGGATLWGDIIYL